MLNIGINVENLMLKYTFAFQLALSQIIYIEYWYQLNKIIVLIRNIIIDNENKI